METDRSRVTIIQTWTLAIVKVAVTLSKRNQFVQFRLLARSCVAQRGHTFRELIHDARMA